MARFTHFRSKSFRVKAKQKGIALILFAFLIGLAMTSVVIKLMSGTSLQVLQGIKTTQVLKEAKATVIGNVVSAQSGSSLGQFPCAEDTSLIGTASEGRSLGSCSNSTASIGRFAWQSLGTGPLTDGNNDKLWYVLSPGFRSTPINSDSLAGLSIDTLSNEAIALITSPGLALSSQLRPTPTSSSPPAIADYLETENSDGDAAFITGVVTPAFNDKLVAIKSDDIFPIIEKRVLGEFKNYLNTYKTVWGTFPFPAPFGNPTLASFTGSTSQSGGFLPVSNTSPTTTWNTSTPPTAIINAPPGNVISTSICSFRSLNTRIRCEITISTYNALNPPTLRMTGYVDNIGLGFYDGLDINNTSDIQITTRSQTATVAPSSRLISHSVDSLGKGIVTFTGSLANTGVVRIEYRRTPPLSNWVLSATNHYLLGGSAGNNWHHLIYYKVAAPFLPGGNALCGSSCLTVNSINATPNVTISGKHAILISAGRKLNATNALPEPTYGASNLAQSRPASALNRYLDSDNNISGGLIFDSTSLPLSTFNDQVLIVE